MLTTPGVDEELQAIVEDMEKEAKLYYEAVAKANEHNRRRNQRMHQFMFYISSRKR